jgi:phosphatidate phosphatase APP1
VPGVIELLHGVRAGPEKKDYKPIYFVSASPNQIHNPIERKMLLDGVQHDGITFKDWARLIRRRQFSQLKNQTAYKLAALMTLTADLPLGCRLILFGDDAEADALTYSIFADVCAGHLRGGAQPDAPRLPRRDPGECSPIRTEIRTTGCNSKFSVALT